LSKDFQQSLLNPQLETVCGFFFLSFLSIDIHSPPAESVAKRVYLQLARVADMEAHVAAKSIIGSKEGGTPTSIDYSATPAVLFTYPQLGMLGKTKEQLKEESIKYWKSYYYHLNWPTYRRVDLKHGTFKILVDKHDHLLGTHFLSDNTTGLLNTFKQAMLDKTPIVELHKKILCRPILHERVISSIC
jgi:glutathione reductase (NADPH)